MERGSREAPYPEYSQEQLGADLKTGLESELTILNHELQQLDVMDAHILETEAQRMRFEKGKNGEEAAAAEIETSVEGFVARELKRGEIQRRIEATERVFARLSK